MLASVIVNGVRLTLIDAAKTAWSDDELLRYLNEAERTTAFLKPDAYTKREFVTLAAGVKQSLPEGGIAILDAGENQASGRVATLVDRELLDHANRFWPAATQETDVQHWAADPRDPRRFDVTPPNNGSGSLEILYGAIPPAVGLSDELTLPDSYQYARECFVLARAYAKNSKRQDLAKSASCMNEYRQALGIKSTAQVAVAPKVGGDAGA